MDLLEQLTKKSRPGMPQDPELFEMFFSKEKEEENEEDEDLEMQESAPEDEQAFHPMPFTEHYEREMMALLQQQAMRNRASQAFQAKNFQRNKQAILEGEKADAKFRSY